MSDGKTPKKCNHCQSEDIVHHVWGRSEFWSCKSCKKEVTPQGENPNPWDPKIYGKGTVSDFSLSLPEGLIYGDWGGTSSEET